jgi:hypothetical protein
MVGRSGERTLGVIVAQRLRRRPEVYAGKGLTRSRSPIRSLVTSTGGR